MSRWDFTKAEDRDAFDAECQDPDNCPDHPWRGGHPMSDPRTDERPWPPCCIRCGLGLAAPGALVFSPPDNDSMVVKYHLCDNCYGALDAWFDAPAVEEVKPGAWVDPLEREFVNPPSAADVEAARQMDHDKFMASLAPAGTEQYGDAHASYVHRPAGTECATCGDRRWVLTVDMSRVTAGVGGPRPTYIACPTCSPNETSEQ